MPSPILSVALRPAAAVAFPAEEWAVAAAGVGSGFILPLLKPVYRLQYNG